MNTDKQMLCFIRVHPCSSVAHCFSFFALELNLAELVETLLTNNPLGRFQRAPGEAFPAARGVAERDGISPTVEADFVGAWNGAGAIGSHVDGARIACLLHLFHQRSEERRAGKECRPPWSP